MAWARVAAVGAVAGFTSGLFGVGGGIVLVPGLVLVAGFSHKLATGTSLSAIVPIALAGLLGYASAGEVDWAAGASVAAGAVVGAVAGTRLLVRVEPAVLQLVFAAAMIVTAVRMFAEEGDGDGRADLTLAMAVALLVVGLAAGFLAGLLGVGGGIIIVPALGLLFGLPHVVAKGTSLAVIVPAALMGTIRNRRSQLTALRPAAVLGAAGIVGAVVASQLSLQLDPRISRSLFAALLVATAIHPTRAAIRERR